MYQACRVKAVSPISEEAGTKIFEALCELYFPDMESAKHQKAKEMQKMLDEPLPKGQDFKTWAMEADMKLEDLRLLGDGGMESNFLHVRQRS